MSVHEYVTVYFDDLLVLTMDSFEDHLEMLELVLTKLQQAGLRVNKEKSNFYKDTVEYLGYLLTHEGIQPLLKRYSQS